MSINIDLKKTYDRLSWQFIRECLEALSLPQNFTDLIMSCVMTSNFNVLWNGNKSEVFSPSRGIRQGHPISPVFVCDLYGEADSFD